MATRAYVVMGTPVTMTITLASLANDAARESTYADLADINGRLPLKLRVRLLTKLQATPTDGTLVRLGASFSNSTTSGYGGGLAGADGAYSTTDNFRNVQHEIPLISDNATGAQTASKTIPVSGRYVSLVVFNQGTGVALSSTAGDHVLEITPIYEEAA